MNSENIVWDLLLSRSPFQIRAAFRALDEETQSAVLAHLRAMAGGEGWHPEQVKSAQVALESIANLEVSRENLSRLKQQGKQVGKQMEKQMGKEQEIQKEKKNPKGQL